MHLLPGWGYFQYNGIRVCAAYLDMVFITFGIALGYRFIEFGIVVGHKIAKFGIDLGQKQVLGWVWNSIVRFWVIAFSSSLQYEPPHDKTNNEVVRPAKTQISLGIRPV